MSPFTFSTGARCSSCSSSVDISISSRIRSSPAKASVICVPIFAICTMGAARTPTKNMYITKSPVVILPSAMALPPISNIRTPIAPIMNVPNADVAETPVMDRVIFFEQALDA